MLETTSGGVLLTTYIGHAPFSVHEEGVPTRKTLTAEDSNTIINRSTQVRDETDQQWSRGSWRRKPIAQHIEYPDLLHLEIVREQLRQLPPLITRSEIERASHHFNEAAAGRAFIIQGGDCAESFTSVQRKSIAGHISLLQTQHDILRCALGKPVIQVGRIAGQYAKPRSKPLETLPNGAIVHAFRGHNINGEEPTPRDRTPDPQRLLLGYFYAAVSLNVIQQIRHESTQSGSSSEVDQRVTRNDDSFYTSHEALHLPYESALTSEGYNLSAAFIWIGERTRQLEGAHVEYVRGLHNPVGVKIGPGASPESVVALLDRLLQVNPSRGIAIITRFGQGKAKLFLPSIIQAVQASGHQPAWICDPCHGNTFNCEALNIKIRSSDTVLAEIKEVYLIHQQHGSHLAGLHLEQTGCDVTECLDQVYVKSSDDLQKNYQSLCDPRLNANQATQIVRQFAKFVTAASGGESGQEDEVANNTNS